MEVFETGKFQSSAYGLANCSLLEDETEQKNQEIAVLKEWTRIQTHLIGCISSASADSGCSWRRIIEASIRQCTNGNAQILWEPLSRNAVVKGKDDQVITVHYRQIKYGILKLAPGYLISQKIPNISQLFADLCALLLIFVEHQTLVQTLLKPLPPFDIPQPLTPRERDVLECMASGKNEIATARQLGIAQTTVRSHRHSAYRRLGVSSPQDAVLRSFAFRLLDWLDWYS